MPAKRRRAKGRLTIRGEARAYFADHGGIADGLILDPTLADLLGRFPLIRYPDLEQIIQDLMA